MTMRGALVFLGRTGGDMARDRSESGAMPVSVVFFGMLEQVYRLVVDKDASLGLLRRESSVLLGKGVARKAL